MPKTGDTPGSGIYVCSLCGEKIVLDNTDDTLPPCPYCYSNAFKTTN